MRRRMKLARSSAGLSAGVAGGAGAGVGGVLGLNGTGSTSVVCILGAGTACADSGAGWLGSGAGSGATTGSVRVGASLIDG
jgi:hypothetical protein